MDYHPRHLMPRLRRLIPLVIVVLCAMPTSALAGRHGADSASSSSPGTGCSAPSSASALNQYCEDVPTNTGPKAPGPRTRAVGGTLARSVIRKIDSTRPSSRVRTLLTLPAAGLRLPLEPAASQPGSSSLPWWLIALLIAIVLTMVAVTIAKRKRDAAT
jgi:hypothetical protein